MPQIEISQNAFDYLQSQAKPLIDTTTTVLDRIIEEHQILNSEENSKPSAGMEMHFGMENLPPVTFTSILNAKIRGKLTKKRDWNNILEELIRICIEEGNDPGEVQAALSAQTQMDKCSDHGFRFVPLAGFSFQGLDAKRACLNISQLASHFSISVEIMVKWQNKRKAKYPNQTARLVFP